LKPRLPVVQRPCKDVPTPLVLRRIPLKCF
jgi:hypothetical protein